MLDQTRYTYQAAADEISFHASVKKLSTTFRKQLFEMRSEMATNAFSNTMKSIADQNNNKPQALRIHENDNFKSLSSQDRALALKNQQKSGRPTTNKEVVNRIEKLFNAVEFKLNDSK